METTGKIKITMNKGFQMSFENGLTISVQIGCGNYCTNYSIPYKDHRKDEITESFCAEIAIWDKNNQWFIFSDQVKGYVSPDEVAIWIDKVKRAKSIKTIKRIK